MCEICPKCGGIAEYNAYYERITCTRCSWESEKIMPMNEAEKKIILSLAGHDMCISKTSRAIHMHRNTIEQHFEKIRQKTGLNPRKFYDLVRLVEIAKEE